MKKEYWRPVLGYEGLYMVSNCGRVKSFDTYRKGKNGSIRICRGRILKPYTNKDGYLCVVLCKNNERKTFRVNRLVAQAFIPNPDNLPCVNHKDECKTNNNVTNLEWCDCKYNVNYGTAIARRSKKRSKAVVQYTLDGKFVREWPSAMDAEREGGFRSECICMCCKGKIKTHKGFIFLYKNVY